MSKISLPKSTYNPLDAWVRGEKYFFKSFLYYEQEVHVPLDVFISIDFSCPAHQAAEVPLQTFEESWILTKQYVLDACELLGRESAGYSLSLDDSSKVLTTLGEPPIPSYPIYIFTVGSEIHAEEIVYIGRTNSKNHRFASGHPVFTKLADPKFDGLKKTLYLASITIYTDEDRYIPLEWIHPKELASIIWKDVEAQLIYELHPEFNIDLKNEDCSRYPLPITIWNHSGSKILRFFQVEPGRIVPEDEWLELRRALST